MYAIILSRQNIGKDDLKSSNLCVLDYFMSFFMYLICRLDVKNDHFVVILCLFNDCYAVI